MGMLGKLSSISLSDDEKNVVYTYDVSTEELFNFIEKLDPKQTTEMLQMSVSGGNLKSFAQQMVDSNLGLKAIFKFNSRSKSYNITADELKQALENPVDPHKADTFLYDCLISNANIMQGHQIGPGMTMDRVYDDGDNLVYQYTIATNGEPMVTTDDDIQVLKKEMKQQIFKDPAFKFEKEILYRLGKGLTYRYISSVGNDTIEVTFTNSELN